MEKKAFFNKAFSKTKTWWKAKTPDSRIAWSGGVGAVGGGTVGGVMPISDKRVNTDLRGYDRRTNVRRIQAKRTMKQQEYAKFEQKLRQDRLKRFKATKGDIRSNRIVAGAGLGFVGGRVGQTVKETAGNWSQYKNRGNRNSSTGASGSYNSTGDAKKFMGLSGKEKTKAEVKKAMRKKTKETHPDMGGSHAESTKSNDYKDIIEKSDWFNKLAYMRRLNMDSNFRDGFEKTALNINPFALGAGLALVPALIGGAISGNTAAQNVDLDNLEKKMRFDMYDNKLETKAKDMLEAEKNKYMSLRNPKMMGALSLGVAPGAARDKVLASVEKELLRTSPGLRKALSGMRDKRKAEHERQSEINHKRKVDLMAQNMQQDALDQEQEIKDRQAANKERLAEIAASVLTSRRENNGF